MDPSAIEPSNRMVGSLKGLSTIEPPDRMVGDCFHFRPDCGGGAGDLMWVWLWRWRFGVGDVSVVQRNITKGCFSHLTLTT